ncbi:putative protein prenylyltransferase [Erysiphe neolycopersici]|uniref:Protein prenyltransferase alpha subunit repeat-containing protein 1 n=1 Tax=Erysiphe neolycopersici TaxID=212602 RepID=A0A420I3C2_9PEZI|nr:putative protein prenylyltransferase [Erysiphe neolycopersici]
MSRVLDVGVEDLLIKADLNVAYENITRALNSCSKQKLEIEILGKNHVLPPGEVLLQEGPFIAIPKARLLEAFIVARKIFFRYFRNCPSIQEVNLRNATSVMLLMDSENLTAANTRKRLLVSHLERAESKIKNDALNAELRWVDGYLTSHLHRHTKSPILWAHRKWVLEQSQFVMERNNALQDLKDIILISAQRHPRNYYAWSHMRWLHTCHHLANTMKTEDSKPNFDSQSIISIVEDWCLKNPSDTSGLSFLSYCLISRPVPEDQAMPTFTKILRLAISFKWVHESIWGFLRTLAAYKLHGEENFNDLSMTNDHAVQNQLIAAREWYSSPKQDKYKYWLSAFGNKRSLLFEIINTDYPDQKDKTLSKTHCVDDKSILARGSPCYTPAAHMIGKYDLSNARTIKLVTHKLFRDSYRNSMDWKDNNDNNIGPTRKSEFRFLSFALLFEYSLMIILTQV